MSINTAWADKAVYFNDNGYWNKDDARLCVYWWESNKDGHWILMTHLGGNMFRASMSDSDHSNLSGFKFVRLDNTEWYAFDYGHCWGQTEDATNSFWGTYQLSAYETFGTYDGTHYANFWADNNELGYTVFNVSSGDVETKLNSHDIAQKDLGTTNKLYLKIYS